MSRAVSRWGGPRSRSIKDTEHWTCILLSALVLTVYMPVITFPFHNLDDSAYIWENPMVRAGITWNGFKWALTALHGDVSYWHPITWLSHQLDCQIFGLRPGAHHLTNLLLHMGNTSVLFLFLQRSTNSWKQCAFAAAVFAIHPLQVESVAWIAERKNLLCTLFFLLCLLSYVRYVETPTRRRYIVVLLLFSLALMSKPMAVTLPCILLLLDYWPLARLERARAHRETMTPQQGSRAALAPMRFFFNGQGWLPWRPLHLLLEKVPFFLLSLAVGIITVTAQNQVGALANFAGFSVERRLDNSLVVLCLYLFKTFFPLNLAVIYARSTPWLFWQVILAGAALSALAAASVRLVNSGRFLLFGFAWFTINSILTSGIVQTGPQIMADRYMYLPIIGVAVAVGWSFSQLLSRQSRYEYLKPLGFLAGTVIMGVMTCNQLKYWQTDLDLFGHAVKLTPRSWVAHHFYASALINGGRLSDALSHLHTAASLSPMNHHVLSLIAQIEITEGYYAQALDKLRTVVSFAPGLIKSNSFAEAHRLLAHILASCPEKHLRDGNEAVFHAEKARSLAMALRPSILDTLAAAYAESKQIQRAIDVTRQSIALAEKISGTANSQHDRLRLYMSGKPYRMRMKTAADQQPAGDVIRN